MNLVIGNEYRVVKKSCGHNFEIGQIIKYTTRKYDGTYLFHSLDNQAHWCLIPYEVEFVFDNRAELQKTVDTLEQSIAKLKELIK